MALKTPLYKAHIKAGGKMVEFAGWDMPIHYGSLLEEHKTVRNDAGMFDVSHMAVVDVRGENAKAFLQKVLANDVAKLTVPGKALYSCMLNYAGGILDDLICYYFANDDYRLVVNAATREKDIAWLTKQAQAYNVAIVPYNDYAMLAIQGPAARSKAERVFTQEQQLLLAALIPFHAVRFDDWLIARTGYTGEDGYEIILPATAAAAFWDNLLKVGIKPCGLGARDTLRLEAGLNLYGSDMDETTSPLVSNLTWTVAFEPATRDFIGRGALVSEKEQGIKQRLVGLVLEERRGVLRSHVMVDVEGYGVGETTSGTFSPTLGKAIAFARIPKCEATICKVQIRDKWLPARIVKTCFVKHGKVLV